ncbi:unnamed protein product [Ixodes pacificus]
MQVAHLQVNLSVSFLLSFYFFLQARHLRPDKNKNVHASGTRKVHLSVRKQSRKEQQTVQDQVGRLRTEIGLPEAARDDARRSRRSEPSAAAKYLRRKNGSILE